MSPSTKTAVGGAWLIEDEPIGFRQWATDTVYPFPTGSGEAIIGAAEGCWLRLQDAAGRVSRQHARLVRDNGQWVVADLDSKNGIHHDGARRPKVVLAPGVEIGIGIGGFTLIAESPMLAALREVLARWIGWSDARQEDVDLALRSVRLAATLRGSLQLCGAGDLVAIARLLHLRTLGARPFIVCDPRRKRTDPSARSATNYDSGLQALSAAAGGTLCIWENRQPDDFDQVVKAHRKPSTDVQLVVCTHTLQPSDRLIGSPIVLPPITERASELDRIIDAVAIDAGATPGETLPPVYREWLYQHEASTLSRIEKAARRLFAIHKADGVITHAAAQLGMAHGALSEWFARRTLEIGDDDDDD